MPKGVIYIMPHPLTPTAWLAVDQEYAEASPTPRGMVSAPRSCAATTDYARKPRTAGKVIIKRMALTVVSVLVAAAVAADLGVAEPGTTGQYLYSPELYLADASADKNGDEIIVYQHKAPYGSVERDAWKVAVERWNEVNADHNGKGVQLVNATGTSLPVEAYLDVRELCDGYSGIWYNSRTPSEGYICASKLNGKSVNNPEFIATHEWGHGLMLGHRPAEQTDVSVMANKLGDQPRILYTIGPADVETWEYIYGPARRTRGH